MTMMAETVDSVADQIASTSINGKQDVVAGSEATETDRSDENGKVCADESSANDEHDEFEADPGDTIDETSHQSEVEQKSSVPNEGLSVPERRAEVRQMGLPISTAPSVAKKDIATVTTPVEVKQIKIGDPKVRSKLGFEVVTARVMETAGKKHVAYTIIMKRNGPDPRPAKIERRYNDFCFIYECILKSFHPSILGDFLFPKKVLIGNFKAEVISERTEAFHKFLNLISSCDSLLYSDYFYSFLTSEEHNEAVSHIKMEKYGEAVPLLETIFHIREKLLTASNIMVLMCLAELVSCLAAIDRAEEAFAYTQVLVQCFELNRGHPEAEALRVSYLRLASQLAGSLGHDKKPFDRQLSEMRYAGLRIDTTPSLLEIIRDRYIHRASHTSKLS